MKGVVSVEIWKDVDGFEGLYQISSYGKIKSLHYYGGDREKVLIPIKDKDGYLTIGIWKNKKRHSRKIHRLVAAAFIPNPENLPQVNHKDENPENNMVENLEWCTCRYNINYGTHNLKNAIAQTGKKHTAEHIMKIRANAPASKPVFMIDSDSMEIIEEFPSASEAARRIKGTATNVSFACRNQGTKYKGCFWRYK